MCEILSPRKICYCAKLSEIIWLSHLIANASFLHAWIKASFFSLHHTFFSDTVNQPLDTIHQLARRSYLRALVTMMCRVSSLWLMPIWLQWSAVITLKGEYIYSGNGSGNVTVTSSFKT